MDLFAEAARLNNEGINALVEGDDKTAIDVLTRSIKLMKQELSKPGTSLKDFKPSNLDNDCTNSTIEVPGFHGAQESFIFSGAITIPETGEHDEQDIHVYSAVVIFNLALAHHRQALALSCKSTYMTKAEKLYGMVLKLLDDCVNRAAVIVKLASINNLAQIRFDSGDYEHARHSLEHISSFMRSSAAANHAMFEEPEIQSLLMNVLLLKAPKVAPAA